MKKFKTEAKRILDLMINSIYTNKEIFLRELISNCSDAIDKRHYESLTDATLEAKWQIEIVADTPSRTITISDNGCGMNDEELEKYLGTIAHSGTLAFKEADEKSTADLIGQFGVGFYSAFMVADKVTVISRKIGDSKAYVWQSEGADGYTVSESTREQAGTTVILHLKDDDEDCKYTDFLSAFELKMLVKKYSDYIRYPIIIDGETVNSMVPIWRRPKGKVKKEEYDLFYREKFYDFNEPLKVISAKVEGAVDYSTLLFIPSVAPHDYYSKDYVKGLKLYSNGVLITDKCSDVIADWCGFIKGVVDSSDLSLNISRELLQKDRQLRAIAVSLEKKIIAELKKTLKNERELYEKMFAEFGASIKMGAYDNFGSKKDELKDLLLFKSTFEDKYVTFAEYVTRVKEGQDCIYYASASSINAIKKLPQAQKLLDDGYEILLLNENLDEFVIKVIESYETKKFRSISDGSKASTEAEKQELDKLSEKNKDVLQAVLKALGDKVSEVRLTNKLTTHAVCLTAEGDVSLEMERVLSSIKGGPKVKAKRVLEINPDHSVMNKLTSTTDDEKLKELSLLLYSIALLQEGLPVDDSQLLAELITKTL